MIMVSFLLKYLFCYNILLKYLFRYNLGGVQDLVADIFHQTKKSQGSLIPRELLYSQILIFIMGIVSYVLLYYMIKSSKIATDDAAFAGKNHLKLLLLSLFNLLKLLLLLLLFNHLKLL